MHHRKEKENWKKQKSWKKKKTEKKEIGKTGIQLCFRYQKQLIAERHFTY